MRVLMLILLALMLFSGSFALAGKGCRAFEDLAEEVDEGAARYAKNKCRGACTDDDAEEIYTKFARSRDRRPDRMKSRDALDRHNEEARSVFKQHQLDKDQARRLHDEITKQNLSREEILQRASDMFY